MDKLIKLKVDYVVHITLIYQRFSGKNTHSKICYGSQPRLLLLINLMRIHSYNHKVNEKSLSDSQSKEMPLGKSSESGFPDVPICPA